ncbi:MAG: PSD1 and planctomycete cytochrome C domain-containing protein [Gemmataceae bacterium]
MFRPAWIVLLLLTPAAIADSTDDEFFEAKVRPILVEHCHACHGSEKAKGGLRLNSRENFIKGGDNGPVADRLIEAVGYKNPELQMPPKGRLPEATIATLTAWVSKGTPWPVSRVKEVTNTESKFDLAARKSSHWAWKPIQSRAVPSVQDSAWPRGPVDRFVLAALERNGKQARPSTNPRTLIRRLTFDLIGLPPDPVDVESYAAHPSDANLARYVDQLLSSPRFGERWARHWLDLVRYAETRGHEFDYPNPNAHHYRDYVIRAMNADVPYDQFVREHVAGDLLPNPRRNLAAGFDESILGTGFWFFGEQIHSPVDLRQDEADHIDNQLDVFGKAFLGLTIACARCHDHKFDAIGTRDYYSLSAVLHSSAYRLARFDTVERERAAAVRLREIDVQFAPILQREVIAALRPHLAALADKVNRQRPSLAEYEIDPKSVIVNYSTAPVTDWRSDGPVFGIAPRYPGDFDPTSPRPRIVTRQAAYADPLWDRLSVAAGSDNDPGDLGKVVRAGRTLRTPEFVLKSPKLYYLIRGQGLAYAAVQSHTMIEGPLHRTLVRSVTGSDEFRWVEHDVNRYPDCRLHVEFTPTSPNFAIAAVVQGNAPPRSIDMTAELTTASLNRALERMADDAVSARIVNWMLTTIDPDLPSFAKYRATRKAVLEGQDWTSRLSPALWDGNGVNARVAIRGNPKASGDEVPRRFLEALSGDPLPGPGSGRLELADRMTDWTVTPFVPRVIVNRVWHHLFGCGIVATTDNFGVLGESPSDAELLDWLADDFVRRGWSVKSLIRALVLSSTYRSALDQPRRLDGEAIRDSLLSLGGNLSATMYGPSVRMHLTPFMDGRGRPKESGPVDGGGRRSVYGEVRRNFLSPFLLAFDAPVPSTTVGRRSVSNVPAQALVLLNDSFVHEQARRWGQRVSAIGADATTRIDAMYRQAFARLPSEGERAACLEFVRKQAMDRGVDMGDMGVWADLAHTLVNVKEFIFLSD